ncbi:hypothetical protein Tco_0261208 [Tanacetum coccineum]
MEGTHNQPPPNTPPPQHTGTEKQKEEVEGRGLCVSEGCRGARRTRCGGGIKEVREIQTGKKAREMPGGIGRLEGRSDVEKRLDWNVDETPPPQWRRLGGEGRWVRTRSEGRHGRSHPPEGKERLEPEGGAGEGVGVVARPGSAIDVSACEVIGEGDLADDEGFEMVVGVEWIGTEEDESGAEGAATRPDPSGGGGRSSWSMKSRKHWSRGEEDETDEVGRVVVREQEGEEIIQWKSVGQ